MSDASPANITKSRKKSYMLCISKPKNEVVVPWSGYKALNLPASLFANALARNHTAMSNDDNFNGDSLLNKDIPIGERQSSPQVCRMYSPVSQIIPTLIPGCTSLTPVAIHKYPSASNSNPSAIFVGDEGSYFPSLSQIHAKTGAKLTTNNEFNDWKKLAGTSSNRMS